MHYRVARWTVPKESAENFGLIRLAEALRYDWPHAELAEQWSQQNHWRLMIKDHWSLDREHYHIELWAYSTERVQLIWDVLSA